MSDQVATFPKAKHARVAIDAPAPFRFPGLLLGVLGLLAVVLLWYVGTVLLPRPESFVQRFSPVAAIASIGTLARSADLATHILVSLRRVLVGLSIAVTIGVPLGLAVGSWRPLDTATSPVFQLLRMISPCP